MLTLAPAPASELRGMRSEWPEGVQSAGGRQHASINHGPGSWQVKKDKAHKGLCYGSAMRDEEAISEHSIDLVL